MYKLFVYGTLLDTEVQKLVFGRSAKRKSATLPDYKIKTIAINAKNYPIAVKALKSQIQGAILEVSDSELALIEQYEGKHYTRTTVTLKDNQKAETYLSVS